MISLQNFHIDSNACILANSLTSFRPKCIFWWMFKQIATGLYCLHVLPAPEVFSWLSDNALIFRVRESAYEAMAKMERKGVICSANGQ